MQLNRFWTLKTPIPLFSRLTFQFRVRILHHSGFSQESDAIDWIDARFHLARLRFGRARKLRKQGISRAPADRAALDGRRSSGCRPDCAKEEPSLCGCIPQTAFQKFHSSLFYPTTERF
jgi:hypothetical protein